MLPAPLRWQIAAIKAIVSSFTILYISLICHLHLSTINPIKSLWHLYIQNSFTSLYLNIKKLIMISKSKLIRMAKKWQRKVAMARRRILFPQRNVNMSTNGCSSSSAVAEKGHVVMYTADHKRYSLPISYLSNYIFGELLQMAEEEFGLPSDGPITIPCEAIFLDYLMSLMHRSTTKEIEKALLLSVSACRCSSSSTVYQLESGNYSLVQCCWFDSSFVNTFLYWK